jgi:hypothetical protein
MIFMSCGGVTKIVISAYAKTAVLWVLWPILIPVKLRSNRHSNGFEIKAQSNNLIGQPCLTEHRTGRGPARWPLICTEDNAWSYIAFMRAMKRVLHP